jgi:hypothetical protein
MSISAIAAVLGVSKSFLYSLIKAHPDEASKSREDHEQWSDFVNRHRIEPGGGVTSSLRWHKGLENRLDADIFRELLVRDSGGGQWSCSHSLCTTCEYPPKVLLIIKPAGSFWLGPAYS